MNQPLRTGLSLLLLVLAVSAASQLWRGWRDDRLGAQVAANAKPGDIEMISSVTCVYCTKARAWFTAHQVSYSECMIEHDATCAKKFQALASRATPTLLVRGQVQIGFDAQRVAQALTQR
ncbi:MAG: glutaredoxin family protein [Burkholderiaceae bacterium]|nr:glutaredoxin family protein [Burkholderiaceae bacterium]MDH3459533.1 glutaredoxin family protein [Burkholderiaceae bacterium]